MAAPVCIPTNSARGFPFLHHLASTCCLLMCLCGHSDGCGVVSHCGFICISLMASDVEHLFICLWALLMSPLEKCLCRPFVHFSIGLFSCLVLGYMSCLCILEIKPLSNVPLANVFVHRAVSLFILMMVSLAMQKLFNLM